MLSPDPAVAAAIPSAAVETRAPLRLVKSNARHELTPLEREFLSPLLEIQETPPSPSQRKKLWVRRRPAASKAPKDLPWRNWPSTRGCVPTDGASGFA